MVLNDVVSKETVGTILERSLNRKGLHINKQEIIITFQKKKLDLMKTIEEYKIKDGDNLCITTIGILGGFFIYLF